MNQGQSLQNEGTKKSPAGKAMSRFLKFCLTISKLAHQITATNAKSLGNSQEGIHRNRAMSIFQKGKEDDRQAAFFSQFFLGHFQPFAMRANGVSQDAAVCWNGRHAQYKQAEPENNIYYSIILILRDFWKRHKNVWQLGKKL
jgi:hypothetical protein